MWAYIAALGVTIKYGIPVLVVAPLILTFINQNYVFASSKVEIFVWSVVWVLPSVIAFIVFSHIMLAPSNCTSQFEGALTIYLNCPINHPLK